jgi:hypothetical protein
MGKHLLGHEKVLNQAHFLDYGTSFTNTNSLSDWSVIRCFLKVDLRLGETLLELG